MCNSRAKLNVYPNITLLTVMVLGIVAAVATYPAMAEEPTYAAMTAADRTAVLEVLREVDLDQEALVALNVSQAQAVEILSDARTWMDQQKTALDDATALLNEQTVALRQLKKAIRMGTAEGDYESQLDYAKSDLVDARQARNRLLGTLKSELGQLMSETQTSNWAIIQRGWGQQMPARMLALTKEQRQAYGRAMRQYRNGLAAATTEDEGVAVEAEWRTQQSQILTDENRRIIEAYNSYAQDANNAVQAAYQTVLPIGATEAS